MEEQKQTGSDPKPENVAVIIKFDEQDIKENSMLAAIGYVGILCLLPLLSKKDSKICQFHGKQALILFAIEFALLIFNVIPVIGPLIGTIGFVGCIGLSVLGGVKALKGEAYQVPLIYDIAKKINL